MTVGGRPAIVGTRGQNRDKDTTSNGPEGAANTIRGQADHEGHDRLMHRIDDPTDSWAPPFPCPNCGADAAKHVKRIHEGVITCDVLCTQGHGYIVRWMVAA